MPDNTLFRKVLFGGYHKGDVLSYIENLEAEKESLKFSLQEAETKEPELPPELKAEYESTIAQLQEQVASLKKSSENGSDQLRALREETIQIDVYKRQPRDSMISGILYCSRSFAIPASKSSSPVNHWISLSEIFKTSHLDRPYATCSFASSKVFHRGGRRFGSKERIAPLSFAMRCV